MIRCEHCGSTLPDGAIFCGECGRAVATAASRRSAAPAPADRATPPPLQQPDAHGRRRPDPATEAWLPEATLDPATRAWLTGEDRRAAEPPAAVPVQAPTGPQPPVDQHPPRSAPTHVHGSGTGLGDWTGRGATSGATNDRQPHPGPVPPAAPEEPTLDPDAFPAERLAPEDDPEITRAREGVTPRPTRPVDDAPRAPQWEPPVQAAPPAAPAAPSWWVGRSPAAQAQEQEPLEPQAPAVPETEAATAEGEPVRAEPAATRPAAAEGTAAELTDEPDAREERALPDAAAPRPEDAPRPGDTAVVEPLVDRRPPRPAPLVAPGAQGATCHVCGHQLEPDDIFCESCGAVRPAVTAAFTGPVVPLPVERPDWAATDSDDDESVAAEAGAGDTAPAASWRSLGGVPTVPPVPPVPGSLDDVPASAPRPEVAAAGVVPATLAGPAMPPVSDQVPPSSTDADEAAQLDEDAVDDPDEDVDETRIVDRTPSRAPFVLHFSTGERLGVHGSGLLGRLPRPEPGERFDDLLTVHDPGKSVSKTHLELGRDGDDLWVSDRFSGNGTVVRHIDGSIRRCEPGRRYRVERGARVDVGEQFFLVQ